MKLQTAFNKISKHLLTQNKKSSNGLSCFYNSPNGLKCAVGALIPKKYYTKEMEGFGIINVLYRFPDYKNYIFKGCEDERKMLRLLEYAQSVHDHEKIVLWKKKLEEIGKTFHLSTKILEKF